MERRVFDTALGPIWLRGRASAFDGAAPVIFCLTGAFSNDDGAPEPGALRSCLPPDIEVVGAHLPGNHCPRLTVPDSIDAYAEAYSQALDQAFPGRSVLAVGASVGGLVVLGLTSQQVRAALVIDPPLVIDKLWPMLRFLAFKLSETADDDPVRHFIHGVFGVSAAGVEPRDYRPMLDRLRFPVRVVAGDELVLPLRRLQRLPSLLDEPERELIARHPNMRLHVAPATGHNILEQAPTFFLERLFEMLPPLRAAAASQGRP